MRSPTFIVSLANSPDGRRVASHFIWSGNQPPLPVYCDTRLPACSSCFYASNGLDSGTEAREHTPYPPSYTELYSLYAKSPPSPIPAEISSEAATLSKMVAYSSSWSPPHSYLLQKHYPISSEMEQKRGYRLRGLLVARIEVVFFAFFPWGFRAQRQRGATESEERLFNPILWGHENPTGKFREEQSSNLHISDISTIVGHVL